MSKTIAHLQLKDKLNNKKTLICRLTDEGYIDYILYGGHNSSGTPYSISNLHCDLPLNQLNNETKEEFVERLKDTLNTKTLFKVENEVKPVSW